MARQDLTKRKMFPAFSGFAIPGILFLLVAVGAGILLVQEVQKKQFFKQQAAVRHCFKQNVCGPAGGCALGEKCVRPTPSSPVPGPQIGLFSFYCTADPSCPTTGPTATPTVGPSSSHVYIPKPTPTPTPTSIPCSRRWYCTHNWCTQTSSVTGYYQEGTDLWCSNTGNPVTPNRTCAQNLAEPGWASPKPNPGNTNCYSSKDSCEAACL